MKEEIKGLKDEICELVSNLQTEIKSRGTATDETITKMSDSAAKLSEDLQKVNAKIEAEEKSRKELEAIIARPGSKDGEKSYSDAEYKAQFDRKIRRKGYIEKDALGREIKSMVDFYMPNADADDKDFAVKMLSVGSNPDGGYYVPVDNLRGISTRIEESSPMRPISNVITTANEAISWIIDDEEADSGWKCEYQDISDNTDTPGLGELVITTHEQYAYPKATQKILDDASVNMETWLQNKLSTKLSRTENSSFLIGDAVNKPRGYLTLPAWVDAEVYERGALGTYTTAASLTIASADLVDMISGLLEDYQSNANWMMHRLTWAEILKLEDGYDRPLINPQLLFQGVQPQLLGKPIVFAGDMPKPAAGVFTAGQKVISYGDFREGYTIVDRMGIRIIRDNITSKGFVKWFATKRVGGDVTNYQAIKILDIKS